MNEISGISEISHKMTFDGEDIPANQQTQCKCVQINIFTRDDKINAALAVTLIATHFLEHIWCNCAF